MSEQAVAVATPVAAHPTVRTDRWFYVGVAIVAILISAIGFGPSIVDPTFRNGPPTALVIAHVISLTLWLLLFLTQAALVATGRTAVHRRLGIAGGVLATMVFVLGVVASIETTRRGRDLSGDIARAAG